MPLPDPPKEEIVIRVEGVLAKRIEREGLKGLI